MDKSPSEHFAKSVHWFGKNEKWGLLAHSLSLNMGLLTLGLSLTLPAKVAMNLAMNLWVPVYFWFVTYAFYSCFNVCIMINVIISWSGYISCLICNWSSTLFQQDGHIVKGHCGCANCKPGSSVEPCRQEGSVLGNMFSLRIVSTSHYQAEPLPDLDVLYSSFRSTDVRKVPVLRIFGATPAGDWYICMCVCWWGGGGGGGG